MSLMWVYRVLLHQKKHTCQCKCCSHQTLATSRIVMNNPLSTHKKKLIILFLIHLFLVLRLTLIDRQSGARKAMLYPFWELMSLLENIGCEPLRRFWLVQIFGNIAMFMPFGFLLPYVSRIKRFRQVVLAGLAFSVCIEITQYITGRGLCEFDDVFNNTLGTYLGFRLRRFLINYRRKYLK